MKKYNSKILYCILIFVFFLIICSIFVFIQYNSVSFEEELYSLERTVNENDLKQMGYIDTTNIHQAENKKIKEFLRLAQGNQKATLRTFYVEDGELYAKIFYSDPELKEIRLWTFTPLNQVSIDPDKRFSEAYNDEKNNMVTVILVNKKNDSLPIPNQTLIDEILYSYYKSDEN